MTTMLTTVRDRYVYGAVNWASGAELEHREAEFDEWYTSLLPDERTLAGWIAEGYEPGERPQPNNYDLRAAEYALRKMRERMGALQ